MRRATSRADVMRKASSATSDLAIDALDASPQKASHARGSSLSSTGSLSSNASAPGASARRGRHRFHRPSMFFALCALVTTTLATLTHEGRSATCARTPTRVVFVDAGSTGCRAHAFAIENARKAKGRGSLFEMRTLGTKEKTRLPLAEMGGRVREELMPAVRAALAKIPDRVERARTPVYVWATAGFRVLTPAKQQALWREVREAVEAETGTRHGYGHFRTVDGAEEGFYAWLAANYLSDVDVTAVGRLNDANTPAPAFARVSEDDNPLLKSVGAIDVGGGSVQYVALPREGKGAFVKSMLELRNAVKVESFLGYGANHMETRWRGALAAAKTTRNACAFPGHVVTVDGVELTGTGEYRQCVVGLRKQIASMQREQKVTLRMPDDFKRVERFLGMSLLFHLTNFITVALPGALPSMPKATLAEIATAGEKLCAIEWAKLVKDVDGKDPNTPADRLNGRCFDAALVQALLGVDFAEDDIAAGEVGLGFSQNDERLNFIERIDDAEVEWTLGAAMSVVHPTAARSNSAWAKTRVPTECARVLHTSFLNALYEWGVIIMPAALVATGYLLYKTLRMTANVATMARSPSYLEVL